MRTSLLAAAAATMLWSTPSLASVDIKVGYSNLAGTLTYNKDNQNAVPPAQNNTTETEDISVGVVTFGGEATAAINDMFSVGFEIGASMTSDFTFDDTKRVSPAAGSPNQNDGDSTVISFSKIPLLAKLGAGMKAGPGMVALDLGVGVTLIAWQTVMTDQQWWDGITYSPNSNKLSTSDKTFAKDVTTMQGVAPAFTFEVTPAYHYAINDKSSVGLEIPLAFVSKTVLSGEHYDSVATSPTPPSYPSPFYGGGSQGEIEMGGLSWGVNIVYKVKI